MPTFSVRSGPCTTTAGGACFRSSGYPNAEYGKNERCDILVSGSGLIKATSFDTEQGFDILTIDGRNLSGYYYTDPAILPGLVVQDGTIISWHSDASTQGNGFEFCGVP